MLCLDHHCIEAFLHVQPPAAAGSVPDVPEHTCNTALSAGSASIGNFFLQNFIPMHSGHFRKTRDPDLTTTAKPKVVSS